MQGYQSRMWVGRGSDKPVTKGQYVVSNTRCPALHACELEWKEAGQRPRRGRSPVEHRGTFVRPSVHPSDHPSLPGPLRPEICPLRPQTMDGRANGRMNKQKSPCVLQDIVPIGAAALLTITFNHQHIKQGNGYRWPHIALGRLV